MSMSNRDFVDAAIEGIAQLKDDLPAYIDLFGEPDILSGDFDQRPSTARQDKILFKVSGKFFIFPKGSNRWLELGNCELKITQNVTDDDIHVTVSRKRIDLQYVEHPLSAFKALRKHRSCTRSRVWSLRADCDGEPTDKRRAVYCFRCKTAEDAKKLDIAYKNAHQELNSPFIQSQTIYSMEGRLFTLATGASHWLPKGSCTASILRHVQTGELRLVVKHRRTGSICANHHVSSCEIVWPHKAPRRSRTWRLAFGLHEDGDDEKASLYSVRFANSGLAVDFEQALTDAQQALSRMMGASGPSAACATRDPDKFASTKTKYDPVEPYSTTSLPPPPEYEDRNKSSDVFPSTQSQTGIPPPSYTAYDTPERREDGRVSSGTFGRLRRALSRFF